ncbi:hypothetical protein IMSHALPRED_005340 [Imshaugia aleurites]|uniref:Wax synthase domain-containing protein n=1 Tax=Imshaugia aleurites TaxID=172621 RepID=A0A8H3FEL2_9LECA|nr:hypothetical protein IMSHALPRED_005340 [Imshaugia aleurites]
MSMPLLSKLKWSAALYVNPRGIGWNYQVKGIPEQRASDTRRGFFIQQFKEIAVVYLALDVLNIYTSRYYYKPGVDPLTLTIRADTWPRGIWNAYSGMANQVLTTSYLHLQIATFSVLLGGSQPKDWPPLYGSFTEAYTIRRYWNTFWHQITRHMFVAYSRDLRAILHIRRGTWLSSYFDLYFTFTFSALFHGITMYAMPYGPNHSFNLRFMMWFHFMFWQAPAIQFEDLVIWCYKRIVGTTEGKVLNEEQQRQRRSETNVRTWHRIVGYIWVFGWWYYILPWPVDTVLRFEIAKASPLPFSVLNPVLTWAENITSSSG